MLALRGTPPTSLPARADVVWSSDRGLWVLDSTLHESLSLSVQRRPVGSLDLLPRNPKAKRTGARRSIQQAERNEQQQEAAQRAPRSFTRPRQVTIHRPCRAIMSSQGARGSPEGAPREILRSFSGAESSENLKRAPHKPSKAWKTIFR